MASDARVVNGRVTGAQTHVLRIMKDIREFYTENPKSMHIIADENDVTTVHALIRGPERTPYHNGFFYFVFRFPTDYPLRPPSVKLITTNGNTVRFNPNLYSNGKVCLSILGTWTGPAWSAAQTLFSTMLSIQTLMNEKPYHNEPGFELHHSRHLFRRSTEQMSSDALNYNKMITHETIRVAVIGMLDERSVDAANMPQELKDVMISFFKNNYQFYEDLVRSNLNLDGQAVVDPFRDPSRPKKFDYKLLLEKLLKLKQSYGICDNANTTASAASGQAAAAATLTPGGDCVEPSVASYEQVSTKMLSVIAPSKPKPPPEDGDNWDAVLEDMANEEDELEDYEEDDLSAMDVEDEEG